jgi:hypothetical protein
MIKVFTAYTRESRNAGAAVGELRKRLDLEGRRLKNSVGIFAFHPDYLDSGAVKALGEALPFDTIGGTTAASAVGGANDEKIFTVSVLTSDDVVFRAGASRPIEDDANGPIRELYSRVAPPEMGKPSLLIALGPVIESAGGDDIVAAIDEISGGVPLFGTLAFTPSEDLSGIEACANGRRFTDAVTLIAFFGEVDPRFHISLPPEAKRTHEKALITQAEKNRVERINGFIPVTYLEKIGLAERGRVDSDIITHPFVLTLKDGSCVVRDAYKVADDGSILCYGSVPKGARVTFSEVDTDFVLFSASELTDRILADALASASENVLIFSCGSRRWILEAQANLEMMETAQKLGASLSYHLAYSGGEICPVKNAEGQWVNRFHNFSMIACVF